MQSILIRMQKTSVHMGHLMGPATAGAGHAESRPMLHGMLTTAGETRIITSR